MKKVVRNFFALSASVVLLGTFCVRPSYAGEENQFFGTLTGATFGGIIGNQFGHGDGRVATTAGGAIAGAWAGNEVGYALDNRGRSAPASGGYYASPSSSGSFSYRAAPYRPNYVAPND